MKSTSWEKRKTHFVVAYQLSTDDHEQLFYCARFNTYDDHGHTLTHDSWTFINHWERKLTFFCCLISFSRCAFFFWCKLWVALPLNVKLKFDIFSDAQSRKIKIKRQENFREKSWRKLKNFNKHRSFQYCSNSQILQKNDANFTVRNHILISEIFSFHISFFLPSNVDWLALHAITSCEHWNQGKNVSFMPTLNGVENVAPRNWNSHQI